jgi:hypothetical protein
MPGWDCKTIEMMVASDATFNDFSGKSSRRGTTLRIMHWSEKHTRHVAIESRKLVV